VEKRQEGNCPVWKKDERRIVRRGKKTEGEISGLRNVGPFFFFFLCRAGPQNAGTVRRTNVNLYMCEGG